MILSSELVSGTLVVLDATWYRKNGERIQGIYERTKRKWLHSERIKWVLLRSCTLLLAGLFWLTPAQAQVVITNLTAVPDSTSSIRLSFGSVLTFQYQMARPGTSWGLWTNLPADKIVRGLAPGTTYSFRVRVPAGADSLIVSAATSAPPPPPPPPPPVTCSTTTPHVPGGPDGMGGCWPGPKNTGVPAGTTLTLYPGPCTITTVNSVISAKTVNCSLDIRTTGVRIVNSKITGSLSTNGGSATVENTEIVVGSPYSRGIVGSNWIVRRVNIHGGYSGVWCTNCTVEDSYIHDQDRDDTGKQHASAIRMDQGLTLRHNTLLCNAPIVGDGGCSADLTGYGDFQPVKNNTIEANLFMASIVASTCAYGGSSGDNGIKPYGGLAENIVFKYNVFQRGSNRKCGYYFPITDFDSSRPGNQWLNNRWDDGTTLPPAN